MSVVIDMEMPGDCFKCQINRVCSHRWFLNPDEGRPDDCPIKAELPAKHGRLIDADDVKRRMIPLSFSVQKWIGEVELSNCKTVIEAEGEA